jgi:hypothetical protein
MLPRPRTLLAVTAALDAARTAERELRRDLEMAEALTNPELTAAIHTRLIAVTAATQCCRAATGDHAGAEAARSLLSWARP